MQIYEIKTLPVHSSFFIIKSILIFCATRKADAEKFINRFGMQSTTAHCPGDNFDALTNDPDKNAKLTASAVSYYIGYMITIKNRPY
jgi:hypothetical protein